MKNRYIMHGVPLMFLLSSLLETLLKHREISINELSRITGISRETVLELCSFIPGIRVVGDNDRVVVEAPLDAAIYGIRRGVYYKRIAPYLDWHDFELFSKEILSGHGYIVRNNFRLTRPVRLEIDVVGIDVGAGRCIIIDCKHWTRGVSPSALKEIADRHKARAVRLAEHITWAISKWKFFKYTKTIIPLVITLTKPKIRAYDDVVIMSIYELNNFLKDIYMVIDYLGVQPVKVDKYTS